MNSILDEISMLRKGSPLTIDHTNSNRYRVVAVEDNGSKTAYYFSTPIYNNRTRKAVDMKFHTKDGMIYSTGSGTTINISNSIRMENAEGSCIISLSDRIRLISEHEILCGSDRIYPTTNGVAIRSAYSATRPYSFTIEVSKPFLEVRSNDKYFALMSEKFRPFVVASCIGTVSEGSNIIAPAKISFLKITDRKYEITVSPCSTLVESVFFEINLHEAKLFQDTTVESNNPKTNNAFGSVGFIGSTREFGEQWLYARPDYSQMHELNDKKISRAILHIPRLNHDAIELTALRVAARFCSFGSMWDNKIAAVSSFANSQSSDHYINLDMLPILADSHGRLTWSEGIILRAKKKDAGFAVIATGDNYITPQILEIGYC